jgi:DNA-binding transcriptional LysR family regulator
MFGRARNVGGRLTSLSRKTLTVDPQGSLIFDDADLVIQAAIKGIVVGMALEASLAPFFENMQLVKVLEDWYPEFPGFFLYYPSGPNQPAALTALIQTSRP